MPEGLLDAFDAPIAVTLGGTEYLLPLLDLDDVTAIGRQMTAAAKAAELKNLPVTATPEQRAAVSRAYDGRDVQVDDITAHLFTLPGASAFLRRSLAKATPKPDDAGKWVTAFGRANGWQAVVVLARRVSGMFPPEPRPERQPEAGAADPNLAGGEPAPATGEPTESPLST